MRKRAEIAVAMLLLGVTHVGPARSEPAAGLLSTGGLVTFDTAAPQTLTARTITGLQSASEHVLGLDYRPATGQVFIVTVPIGTPANALVRTYALDVATATATFVGSIPSTVPGAADVPSSVDFNPRVDRLRMTNVNDENFRINPNTGALAGDDPNLNAPGSQIVAEAYDRNFAGDTTPSTPTTLYGISRATASLVTQGGIDGMPGANSGIITTVGPLGVLVDPGSDAGLDISAATGTAYAVIRSSNTATLYTIDLVMGQATFIGAFPAPVVDLTILPPPALPPPDTTAPHGLLDAPSTLKLKAARQGFTVGFSCDEACSAIAQLVAKEKVLATGSATLAAAGVGSLSLAPTAEGSKALRRRLKRKAELSVTLTDGAGNQSPLTRALVLRP
jgi:hypothetical protein